MTQVIKTSQKKPIKKTKQQLPRDKKTGRLKAGIAQKTNKHGTAGRPTKYKHEYCQRLLDYCSKQPFSEVDVLTTDKRSGREYVNKELRAIEFPTLERFAFDIGVNDDTLNEWASARYAETFRTKRFRGKLKHPEFSAAYRAAKELQKHILVTNGLMGLYNSNFAKFVAINFTTMRDRQELTGADGQPLMPIALDSAVLARRTKRGNTPPSPTTDSQ